MSIRPFRSHLFRACAATVAAFVLTASAHASILVSDGFGDGDRDNNGLDPGAAVRNPSDVGIPWLRTDGSTGTVICAVKDDGLGNNVLRVYNTASAVSPSVGHFAPRTLNNGESLILRLDLTVWAAIDQNSGTNTTADRAIRFGLYHDTNGDDAAVDHSNADGNSLSVDDVGYNIRLDAANDTSNSTSMDVTRDDSPTGFSIIQATTTGIGVASTNAANQMLIDGRAHHFEFRITRSGANMLVSLQKDSNGAITGTDTAPPGFTFDEIALGVRSNNIAIMLDIDNIQLEYIQVPEPASLLMLTMAGVGLLPRSTLRRPSPSRSKRHLSA